MYCKKIKTELCGCLTICEGCNTNDLEYQIKPKIDLQNSCPFKCKPALLKGKVYKVQNGKVETEFGEMKYIGNLGECYLEYGEYIEII